MADHLARYRTKALIPVIACCLVIVSVGAEAQRNRGEEIVVAPIGEAATEGMTRTALEESVRRFADRFYTSVTQTTDGIRDAEGQDEQIRLLMHQWKTVSAETIVGLAIGEDPVTNLLDMMVLTTLSRLMIDGYWTPNMLGPEAGQAMSDTYAMLEADIWGIGAEVLTPGQIDTLRDLVDDWYRENPDQAYPWYVRFDEFADQRAVALRKLGSSGGVLGIREARESIEDFRAFAERVLFYLQRAPALMSYEMQSSVYQILAADEVASLVQDADQFSGSVEDMVEVIAKMPSERLEAIDQLVELLGAERRALVEDIRNVSPEAEGVLEEGRRGLEAFERILMLLEVDKQRPPDAKAFNISDYTTLATETRAAAEQLAVSLEAFEALLKSPAWENSNIPAEAVIHELAAAQTQVIDRLFVLGGFLIVLFFICLIAYRLLMARVFSQGAS